MSLLTPTATTTNWTELERQQVASSHRPTALLWVLYQTPKPKGFVKPSFCYDAWLALPRRKKVMEIFVPALSELELLSDGPFWSQSFYQSTADAVRVQHITHPW